MSAFSDTFAPMALSVVVVKEPVSLWTEQDVLAMVNKANKVLKQCSIYIVIEKSLSTAPQGIVLGYESAPVANPYYLLEKKPILFLISTLDYKGSVGLTPGSNSIFLSYYSRSAEYANQRHKDYEPLAHELGHMLGSLPHLTGKDGSNLMAAYIENQSAVLSFEQCQKMREHKDLVLGQ